MTVSVYGSFFVVAVSSYVAGATAPAAANAKSPAHSVTCNSVAACVLGQNTGAGLGIAGSAVANDGVAGQTTFAATSASNAKAGVYGRDATAHVANKYNYGTLGASAFGTGAGGASTSGVGVIGTSVSSYGVEGISKSGNGVVGKTTFNAVFPANGASGVTGYDQSTISSTQNAGVFGYSPAGTGVRGKSGSGNGVVGLSGDGLSTVGLPAAGVAGLSYGGVGVNAASTTGDALSASVNAPGIAYGSGAAIHAYAWANSFPPNPNIFIGTYAALGFSQDVVSIDIFGNMILNGTLTQNGTPLARTLGADGKAVASFGERTSAPTLDDMGEARLVAGNAYVPLDPAFANAIDARAKYLVFVTPQSNSRGLFVDHITATGFQVHENDAGRSSLTFDYRIAAKPYDAQAQHLPALPPLRRLGAVQRR